MDEPHADAPKGPNVAAAEQQPADASPAFLQALPLPFGDHETKAANECDAACQRDVEDLNAQKEMARAAWGMFWATIVGVGIGSASLFLIWRTVVYAKQAAIAAGRAADEAESATTAARDTLAETRMIGQAQVRAYLYCKGASYKRTKDSLTATLHIENKGQSPASDVSLAGECSMYHIGGTPGHPRTLSWVHSIKEEFRCQPIGVGGITTEDMTFFGEHHFAAGTDGAFHDPDARRAVFADGNELTFDIAIRWKDVFERHHEVTVALRADVDASPYSRNKKRSSTGKLGFRVDEYRHGVDQEKSAAVEPPSCAQNCG